MTNERAKFEPSSKILALAEDALGAWFDVGHDDDESLVDADGIATIGISGPLEHHASWWWDSYDSIRVRVAAAFEHEDSKAVILRIDSPGGVAAGATELQRDIRAMREKSGKPIFAYADEMACSAGYELACAADEIWLPDTATVGSIGVITSLYDTTKANEKYGVRIQLVTSGKRKADSYSDRVLTPEIEQKAQDRVDYFAGIFFDVVAKARGVSLPKIAGLEAGVYQGSGAVKVKLADGVAGWDGFVAHVKESIMKTKPKGSQDTALAAAMAALLATADDPDALVASLDAAAKSKSKAKKEDADEDESGDEDAAAASDDDSSTDGSTKDSTDAKAEEKSFFSASNGLYTPQRLVRLCRQVTGEQGSIKSLFGAIDALGQQKKAAEKSATRLEKLEARQIEQDVESMLSKAKADGRISRAQVEHLRASGMKDPKFLKGFLSQLPKLVRTVDEALVPREGAEGEPAAAHLSDDQKKIIAQATAGMNAKEKAEFVSALNERQKNLNGAAKTPSF